MSELNGTAESVLSESTAMLAHALHAIVPPTLGIGYIPKPWPVGSLDEYHADRVCDSNSSLTQFVKSRWGYYLDRVRGDVRPEKKSESLKLGTIFHAAVEDINAVDDVLVVVPEGMKRDERSEKWRAFRAANADKLIVTAAEAARIEGMIGGLLDNPKALDLLGGEGYAEYAVRFLDRDTGLPLKVCFDWLRADGAIVDIKTSAGEVEDFAASLWQWAYYRQAGLYTRARDLLLGGDEWLERTGEMLAPHYHVVVQNEWPFECQVWETGRDTIMHGRDHVRQILRAIKDCRDFGSDGDVGVWHVPGHGTAVPIEMSEWAFRRELYLP